MKQNLKCCLLIDGEDKLNELFFCFDLIFQKGQVIKTRH